MRAFSSIVLAAISFVGTGCSTSAPAPAEAGISDAAIVDLVTDAVPLTTLRVHYPTSAHHLTVRGSGPPLSWDDGIALARSGDVWTISFHATAPFEWKPMLDDAIWSLGPNYRAAPGATVDVYPRFTIDRGKVVRLYESFHSQRLGNDRVVWGYLPPSYEENTAARFPVVYMQDGQNLFEANRSFSREEWRVDETFDRAAGDGTIREAIVVAPENTARRIHEYTPTEGGEGGGGGDRYLEFLIAELKPLIDATLRTIPDRAHTAILGSSLGGLIAAYAGAVHTETFGLIGAMSPSVWWDDRMILSAVRDAADRPIRIYVDSGDTEEDGATDTADLAQVYLARGFIEGADLRWIVHPGGLHSERFWAERLPGALRFLLGERGP